MEVITSQTSIQLGLVFTLVGGVVWLTKMYSLSKQNEKNLELQKTENEKEFAKIWLEIEALKKNNSIVIERMARIETKLDTLIEQTKR